MKRLKKIVAGLLMLPVLLSASVSCNRSTFVPERPVNPEAPDDPGVYEEGLYVTVKGAGMFTGEDWGNAMSAQDLKNLLLADASGNFTAEQAARIDGKVIHLEQGIYPFGSAENPVPVISGETAAFSVTLKGGYKNGGYTQYPAKYHTYLSGASDYRIFYIKGNAKVTLDGVGLTGSRGEGGGQAAAYVSAGELVLNRCDICNNYNTYTVGGIQVTGSGVLRATSCRFFNNVAGNAGALNVDGNAACHLTDCEFFNNASNGQGGAVKVTNGSLKATGCTFSSNYAETRGGALWIAGSKDRDAVLFEKCLFAANSCTNGGGVCWQDGGSSVRFTDCSFVGNYASNGSAGALYANEGADNLMRVEKCRFSGNNSVTYNGGSIHIRGNASGSSVLNCKSCTFENEFTTARGGLIALGGNAAPLATFEDCVISGCHAGENCAVFYAYATNGKVYFNACRFENNYINGTYGSEGCPAAAGAFIGLNNCAVRGSHLERTGANSQQCCWYNIGAGKMLFSNCSLIGVPTASGEEIPTYGLVRLNNNAANVRFVSNIIVSTLDRGCGIFGGDTQTSLTVTGSYNKMSPVKTQKEGTFTYTSGDGDDLAVYASAFPGLAWGENGWAWNGNYSGTAPLAATTAVNTAIQAFDTDFHAWLNGIGALGKDIRGKDRGATSWPGSYQN